MEQEDTSAEGDSDLRYHISASKDNPQDIFSTICNNRGDPAFHVCFLTSNPHKFQLIKFLIFEEIFTEASRPFIRTTNGLWIWWWHAWRIHRHRSKLYLVHRKQDLFSPNLPCLLHHLWLIVAVWCSQPSYTSRYYAMVSCWGSRAILVCESYWSLSCQCLD